MEPMDLLNLVSRWLHILAAITAVGGTIFARFVVVPSLEPLEPGERAGAARGHAGPLVENRGRGDRVSAGQRAIQHRLDFDRVPTAEAGISRCLA